MVNSEDPDRMPHTAAFHHGLHCLLRRERNTIFFGNPSIYTMDQSDLTVSNFMERSTGFESVKKTKKKD